MLEKEAHGHKLTLKAILNHPDLKKQCESLDAGDPQSLYSAIGLGKVSARKFVENLFNIHTVETTSEAENTGIKEKVKSVFRKGTGNFLVHGMDNVIVNRAPCCNPIQGEEIVGYLSPGKGIIVHARDCTQLEQYLPDSEQQVDVSWGKTGKEDFYLTKLLVFCEDRKGMIADVSNKITKMDINIRNFQARSNDRHEGIFEITLDVHDIKQLEKIIRTIKSLKAVHDVVRVEKNDRTQ